MQNTSRDADWTVCDAVEPDRRACRPQHGRHRDRGSAGRARRRAADALGCRPGDAGRRTPARRLAAVGRQAQPDRPGRPRGHQRARAAAPTCPRRAPSRRGCSTRYPKRRALTAPAIPDAGQPGRLRGARAGRRGGGVLRPGPELVPRHVYYAVLPDGLQPISPVLAAILRNTNSYGLAAAATAGRRRGCQAAGVADAGHQRLSRPSR